MSENNVNAGTTINSSNAKIGSGEPERVPIYLIPNPIDINSIIPNIRCVFIIYLRLVMGLD